MIDLPKNPGVYIFKDKSTNIIYVGKAKNLKNRVKSYFQKNHLSPKTKVLQKHIDKVDYIQTNTEVEALLLENKLIKEHSPKYNISLKDDKTYAYIKLSNTKIPKLQIARKTSSSGTYFGPFTDGYSRNLVIKILNRHYQLCTPKCQKTNSCLNYHIGFCKGANINKEPKQDYLDRIKKVKQILNGDITKLKKEVEENMKKASKRQDFETALSQKEILESLKILKKQQVDNYKQKQSDIIAQKIQDQTASYSILKIRKGTILEKENHSVELEGDIFEKFLAHYYYKRQVPKEIIVSEKFWNTNEQLENLELYLQELAKTKVKIIHPQRGSKKQLVELAKKNLESDPRIQLKLLRQKLNLKNYPKVIECFDASNLQDKFQTASMVQYTEGLKTQFRKYKITSKTSQDDYNSLKEAVGRRYSKLKGEKKPLPDLILVDGGLGQLNTVLNEIKKLNLEDEIDVISLAKKEEIIFLQDKSQVKLDKNSKPMLIIRSIRDSAHRLAIGYNSQLRKVQLNNQTKKYL